MTLNIVLLDCRTPYVTGTSVLGITYKDGVMIAADTLGASCLPERIVTYMHHVERDLTWVHLGKA